MPKEGFEPTHPYGYYVLNVARLPFRHFGIKGGGIISFWGKSVKQQIVKWKLF